MFTAIRDRAVKTMQSTAMDMREYNRRAGGGFGNGCAR